MRIEAGFDVNQRSQIGFKKVEFGLIKKKRAGEGRHLLSQEPKEPRVWKLKQIHINFFL